MQIFKVARALSRRNALAATVILLVIPQISAGANIVTLDPAEVNTFVGTVVPIGFDDVVGSAGGIGSIIPSDAEISDNYQNLGVLISSTGGPGYAAVRAVDAVSDPNLLGGTDRNIQGQLLVDFLEPITLNFVVPSTATQGITTLVGAWNDPTGSRIKLEVFDASNGLLGSVEADEGYFLGISMPGIASARFSHVLTQSVVGYTVDDLYLTTPGPVPAPATAWLAGTCIAWLLAWSHRNRARRRPQTV